MKSPNNQTGYKCVFIYRDSINPTYQYRFTFRGIRYCKSGFKTAEDASRAYLKEFKRRYH